jgi:hypothetical protein
MEQRRSRVCPDHAGIVRHWLASSERPDGEIRSIRKVGTRPAREPARNRALVS